MIIGQMPLALVIPISAARPGTPFALKDTVVAMASFATIA